MGVSKKTATTAIGEIEYETAECDHCGNEVVADDAVGVLVGPKTVSHWGASRFKRGESRNLCPLCASVVFDYDGRGNGKIPRGWNALTHRMLQIEEPWFSSITGFLTGCLGALVGLLLASGVLWVIGLVV